MRRNKRWTVDEKVGIVQKYLEEGISFARLAKEYDCSHCLISSWVSRYKEEGTDGFWRQRVKQNYSEEFKLMLIGEVENGQSQAEVTRKYHLCSDSLLSSWIRRYTSGNRLTSKGRMPCGYREKNNAWGTLRNCLIRFNAWKRLPKSSGSVPCFLPASI